MQVPGTGALPNVKDAETGAMEMTLYEVRPKAKAGHILLVDDDPDFRNMVATAFTRAGFSVREATNGKAALAALGEQPVDLIVTDIIMPEADGYEVIVRLQAMPSRPPLIAMSGGSIRLRMELPNMARLLGADAAFEKPLNLAALIKEAGRLIDEHQKNKLAS